MEKQEKGGLRIVFMGTPEFAVPSLKILVENGYNIVGVITATDKYGGRGGKKLIESDIKKYAQSQNLNILQPKNLKAPKFIEQLRSLNADLQVIVAFRMLPEIVWSMPPLGSYNLHGSLLPKYRGAAPIHWAIINGETETGVTSFKLKHKIDTGDLLFQESMSIGKDETTGDVHDRMKELAADVILKTLRAVESDSIELKPQDTSQVSKAPKIFTQDCRINFNQDVRTVHNFIRGLSPFPAAWTLLDGKILKIYKADFEEMEHQYLPGTILSDGKTYFDYTTNNGKINIKHLQLQGKSKMDVEAFLNGFPLKVRT